MSSIPLAVQLYSIREDCARDLAGTLAGVAKMGYDGVEFAGFYDHSATDVRRMLDDNGLRCAGSHTPIAHLQGDPLAATIDFNRAIGNPYLIVPGLPEDCTASLDAWKKTAGIFNTIAGQLEPEGMQTGYHNHFKEFTLVDGEYPWDAFFGNTDPRVIMQLDTGNARVAGVDVAPFIERYPGRATTVHLKEWTDAPEGAVIGEGKIDWQTILGLCESLGATEWYIVEQEHYPYPPIESVERCLRNVRSMLNP